MKADMKALQAFSPSPFLSLIPTQTPKTQTKILSTFSYPVPIPSRLIFKLSSTKTRSNDPIYVENEQEEPLGEDVGEKFDWYSHWYPVMPLCDLDKRVPHGKKVLGLDIVVWWDNNSGEWKVFEDKCPHRLAPFSEGRIDGKGRLQCVYHGWCFGGNGGCEFIPQAPTDGPKVHSSKKACVASYPTIVQNRIVWFWPSSEPQFKDISMKEKPPYIPELDDPSFTSSMGAREIPYGYEVLTENLMDPAHVPYAHYGIMQMPKDKSRPKADREGGRPMEMSIERLDVNGFTGRQENGSSKFIPPCVFYLSADFAGSTPPKSSKEVPSKAAIQRRLLLIFICIPVSPGKSRLIWTFPRNFGLLMEKIIPQWIFHLGQNLILDSDLYLLHLEERKLIDAGSSNWQKACFVPTKSDALVVGFRKWLKKYSDSEVCWGANVSRILPPTPPKEQLMDRYWSHVVNCSSCSVALKSLKALEIGLQIASIAIIAIMASMKQSVTSVIVRTTVISFAVLCFAASKWLSHFIHKNFYFHDYNHALK